MKSVFVKQNIVSFLVGLLFAVGLAISGMTGPQNVIGFLTIENWNPSLLLVMFGAVGVHTLAYPLIKKRASPVFEMKWHIPTRRDLNVRLILGSALFGIGWGLGGYCPGPGVTSLATFDARAIIFVVFMIAGMLLFKKTERYLGLPE